MFSQFILLGPGERSIAVQTRKGTSLKNLIEVEPSPAHRLKYQRWFEKHGQRWQRRKPVTGIYNCAGHVWASRRTSLTNPSQWWMIIEEDGFTRTDTPRPDDVTLYVDEDNGEIIHVARVLELREGMTPDSEKVAWVVSKWGPVSGEAMHFAHDVPYAKEGYRYRIEYWTDRPVNEGN